MQLAIHLFDSSASGLHDLITAEKASDPEYFRHDPVAALGFECVAVGVYSRRDKPSWSTYLDGHFAIEWPGSVGTSVALLAQVENRWFAVTFGPAGRHMLNTSKLVPNFGIKVTANTLGRDRVRSLSSNALDGTGRHTTQELAIPGTVRDFTVDLDTEWVRSLGGWTDDDLTRGMVGSQALRVTPNDDQADLKHLHQLLAYLLSRFNSLEYLDSFPFIDLITPLRPSDSRVSGLDAGLVKLLREGGKADFGVIAPHSQPGDSEDIRYKIIGSGRGQRHSLDWLGIKTLARRHVDPLSAKVEALNQDGPILPTQRLRVFLNAELSNEDETEWYVLSEGSWFLIDKQRFSWLEEGLRRIPEFNKEELPQWSMPRWFKGDKEKKYNESAADENRWLLLDAKNFRGPDRGRDQVERCDLLTSQGEMVCVKKLSEARDLSHLFSQGSVSARLYQNDSGYRRELSELSQNRWPTTRLRVSTVVYAIGTEREGLLRKTLPFFSRINLCNHAQLIRDCHLEVAVLRIPIHPFREPSAVPGQRPESAEQTQDGLFEV